MRSQPDSREYTVAPHLALDGALCLIDTVMIEWHQRYYGHSNLFRVSKLLKLSARTSGTPRSSQGSSATRTMLNLPVLLRARSSAVVSRLENVPLFAPPTHTRVRVDNAAHIAGM